MSGKPYKRPIRARLRALLKTNSVSDVAILLGVNRSSVRLWGLEYGLIKLERTYAYSIPAGVVLQRLCDRHDDAQLAKRFGCKEQTIRSHRHASGIYRSRARRRYALDEKFFERVDTEQKAYVLGFLAADGTIPSAGRSVVLMLQARDVHILRDIRMAMGSDARIMERKIDPRWPNRGPYKFIYFGSQKLVADLMSLGITPRKSHTLRYPILPKRLERHFIRGLLDGDGSIKEQSFCFLGTEHLIDGMRAAIFAHTGLLLVKAHAENKLWALRGGKKTKVVLNWLYENASIYLKRKHRSFVDYWQ